MNFINRTIILAFVSFIIGCLSTEVNVGMKLLVISTSEPTSVIKTLQSYSIDYDYLECNYKHKLEGNLPLFTEDNKPKYYGIVLGNGALSVLHEDEGRWGSILSASQWDYLKEYQKTYGVRVVALDDSPDATYGTAIFDATVWGVSSTQDMKVANNDIAKSIYKEAGIKTTAVLNTKGLYHVPVKVTDTELATPVITFQPNEDLKEESVAAVYFKDKEGRERLAFYISFGDWSVNSVLLNHLWVSWITRSLYAGERRVTFTPHIDDVFISTGRMDMVTGEMESTNAYRSTVEDFKNLKKWQDTIVDILPEGSLIRCELAFNGNGILAAISPTYALEVDGERYCEIEHIKEPGTGKSRWPVENWSLPYDEKFLSQDKLFEFFKVEENRKNFFWSSHTFTHENLDEATTSDADNEIRNNIEMAKLMGVYGKPYWSGKSIITPQISGLRNVDAIKVLKKYGIESGTGDLSRPTLADGKNPYLPFFTSKESSNFEGFPIIPRSPSEIYYSSSDREENTYLYNKMYESQLGKSTWDDILEREVQRAVTLMLNLRNEAHQFHQINIRSDCKEDDYKSLLQTWCTAVLEKYVSYVDWPVKSLKLDDQAELYVDRYNRVKFCDVEKSLIIDGDYVTGIKVTPNSIKKDCKVSITLPKSAHKDKNEKSISYTKIGKDRMVAWVKFNSGDKNSKTIKLNPPLAWNNNAENKEPEQENECWSEELGYRCCKENENTVQYIDQDGWWGVTEDDQWCGVIRNEECWALNFGLPCCESEKLDYIHENGVIGYEEKYENDETRPAGGWCGIKSAVNRVNNNALELFREQLNL